MNPIEAVDPLILTTVDVMTPPGRRFWLDDSMFSIDDDGMEYPRFSVQEVAKCFFGQGPDWLRWRMRPDKPSVRKCRPCRSKGEVPGARPGSMKKCVHCKGHGKITSPPSHPNGFFILDGKELIFKRLKTESEDPNKPTARYYTLADIERMGHALAQQEIIDGVRLCHLIVMVRSCARMYGISDTGMVHEGAQA